MSQEMVKKFSWLSVALSTAVAAPAAWFLAFLAGRLDLEMVVGQLGTAFLTCIIMEKLWPTVTRRDKQ